MCSLQCDTESFIIIFPTSSNKCSRRHRLVLSTELYMTEWKITNPTSSSSQSSFAAMKNFLADGRLTPLSSPPPPLYTLWRTLQPPLFPTPSQARGWSEGAPGQYQSGQHYYRGRNAEQNPHPFPSMSNLSSLYTLFYSVIYNFVVLR